MATSIKKDPFAKERAVAQQDLKKNKSAIDQYFSMLLDQAKGEPGYTPIKGKDYFTPAEITQLKKDILALIPKPKDGKDVDYDLVLSHIAQEVENAVAKAVKEAIAKIPPPPIPKDGKDAKVDIPAIVDALIKVIPKIETNKVDYLGIKDYIDKEVAKVRTATPVIMRNGGTNSLRQLTDVVLDGLTTDSRGNYILTAGAGVNVETPSGTIDGVNTAFTVANEPKYVVVNTLTYFSGGGYTYASGTITFDIPPATGSVIRSIY